VAALSADSVIPPPPEGEEGRGRELEDVRRFRPVGVRYRPLDRVRVVRESGDLGRRRPGRLSQGVPASFQGVVALRGASPPVPTEHWQERDPVCSVAVWRETRLL
jgi:hypothetical protein